MISVLRKHCTCVFDPAERMGYFRDLLILAEAVFIPELATYETEIFAATCIALVVLSLVLGWLCFRRRSKGRTVCLLGLSDAGKTLLYIRLKGGDFMRTYNSITENKSQYLPAGKDKALDLIDIPGNERIRETIFSKHKDNLKAVVVVVDSVNFPQESRSLAELLFDLLSDRLVHSKRITILVACNKQDLALAMKSDEIRKMLEAEITALKSSRAAKPEFIDGGPKGQAPVVFGKKGKDFKFKDLSLSVTFAECSSRGKGEEDICKGDINEVCVWLEKAC